MKKESLTKNFIFQIIYQLIVFLVPLITAPYVTRTVGKIPLGQYDFTYVIAGYFVLVMNLGIQKHGQRIISENRDDPIALRKIFWSLYYDHLIVSLLTFGAYLIFAFFFGSQYQTLYYIQMIYVASAIFDITWLFYGLEQFRGVVVRNAIVKIIECVLIMIIVKEGDLYLYAIITVSSILMRQLVLIPRAIIICKPIKVGWNDMKVHFKPMLVLFVSVAAANLYTTFDRTLLGLLSSNIGDVSLYNYANKIIDVPKNLLNVIPIVVFPRVCKAVADNDRAKQKEYARFSYFLISLGGSACMFGILAIANKFGFLYYGKEFAETGNIMMIMSPLILIVLLGDVFRTNYFLPEKKDFSYTLGLVIASVLNIILSCILIPYLGIYGALIGTIIAELFNLIYEIILSKKLLSFYEMIKYLIPFLIIGAIMFIVVFVIDYYTPTTYLWLAIEIVVGAIVYIALAFLVVWLFFKDYKLKIKTEFKNLINKFKSHKTENNENK